MLPRLPYPITELTIPTTGKTVRFRPLLVKEEKILLMAKTASDVAGANPAKELLKAVQQIVGNCSLDENFDTEDLALVDLEWLFLKLRAISVDNVVKLAYKDEEDGKVYDFTVDLDKVEVDNSKARSKVLDIDETTKMGLRYPRAELLLGDEVLTADKEFDRLMQYTLDWISVGGKTTELTKAPESERKEFIDAIPAKILEEIKKFWDGVPTLRHEIKYTNSKGTERKIVLMTLQDFFTF